MKPFDLVFSMVAAVVSAQAVDFTTLESKVLPRFA